ncbi:tripartite ATP-independent transporter DctP family solute receptor [Cytobacillus purgationiresistens]|uniref:Tripartite ATP-independent transporter DctP family solute receptor n=2 Tax=Cytobacillus purgationiresistens TaxID=863449 RepID=A0ABU0AL64_9BACI|nr:DctP family TRAP transporter solute-binding subunit [Cytobacillus purgationiresistens]MDQ0272007.1 tripartite ATP-independent transporter DctP family solute receptor [Cytobacillus purgationiresistens]
MRNWIKSFGIMLILITFVAGCSSYSTSQGSGQTNSEGYEEATIRLAYNLPQDHHVAKGVEQFAKDVTEKSGGAINVQVYPAGQLLSDKDMNQSILTGGVEMGVNSSTLWASTVPVMGIFDVPYVFNTYEEAGDALNGEFGDKLKASMEEKGAKVLMFADYGFAQFANNKRPLESPADFEGLKIRSIGDIPSEMIKAYGASPVFMGGGEVYMALQRSTVDGATSGTTAMVQRKYDEVTKYLTINNYAYLEFILAVNKDFWNKLPEKSQLLLSETATEAEAWIRTQAEIEDEKTAKQLEEKGMEVYVVPEEDIPMWKEAAKPAWDAFSNNAGNIGKELLKMVD